MMRAACRWRCLRKALMTGMRQRPPPRRYRSVIIAPQGLWAAVETSVVVGLVVVTIAIGYLLWSWLWLPMGCCDRLWIHAQARQVYAVLAGNGARPPAVTVEEAGEHASVAWSHPSPSLLLAAAQPATAAEAHVPLNTTSHDVRPALRRSGTDDHLPLTATEVVPRWQLSLQRPLVSEAGMQQTMARAHAYLQSAQPEMARSLFEDVLRANPHHVMALGALLMMARQQGRVDEALYYQQQIQVLVPDAALLPVDLEAGGE